MCSRELLYRNQQLSPEVRDLIHRLLQKNPADRIKLDKVVEQERGVSALRHSAGHLVSSLCSNYNDPALDPAPLSDPQMLQHGHAPSPRPLSPSSLPPAEEPEPDGDADLRGRGEDRHLLAPILGTGVDSFHSYATLPAGKGKCLVLF